MTEPTDKQTSVDLPKAAVVWECPSCARRYLTNQPPTTCPYCLRPVQRS
jgi:rubrerythrin